MRKPMQKIRHNSNRSIISELTTPEDLNRPQPVPVDLSHSRNQSRTLHQKGKLISQSKNPSHRFLAKKFKKILHGNETTTKSSREDELLDELSEIRSQYSEELNELKVKLEQRSNSITTMERTLRLQAETIEHFRTVVDSSQKEDTTSLTSETEIESDDWKSDGSRERSDLGDQGFQTKRYARRRLEAMPKSKFLPEESDRRSQSAPRLDGRRDNSPDRPEELQKQSSAASIETTDSSPPEERESVYGSMGRTANADFPAHPREVGRRSRSVPKVRSIHSRRSSIDEISRINRNGENRYNDPVNQEIFSRSSQRDNVSSIHSRTSQRQNASKNERSLYSSHQRRDISSSNHETSRLGRRPSSEQPRLSRSCHDGYYLSDIGDSMRSERRSSDIREKNDILDRVRRRNSQNASTMSRRDHDHGKFDERNSRRASLNRSYNGMDDSLDTSGHSASIRRKSLNRSNNNDLNDSETSFDMSRRSSLNGKEDFGDAARRVSPSRRRSLDSSGHSSNVRMQSLNRGNHRKENGFDSSQNSLNLPKRRSLDHSGHSSKLSRRQSLNSKEADFSQNEVSDGNAEIKTIRRPSINRSCHGIDASLDNSGHSSKERRSSLGRGNHEKDRMANSFGDLSEPRLRRPILCRSAYEKGGIGHSSESMSEPRRSSFINTAGLKNNTRSTSASRRRSLDVGPSQGGQLRRCVSEENFGKDRQPEKLPDWAIARKANKSNSQRRLSNGRQRSSTNRFHLAPVVTQVRDGPPIFVSTDFDDDLSQID